ncbi:hypothetical protein Patl1_17268 [Pistacia atlantica]|uniref:Uncharacterized protein n=1 Tax=Pistacia atlantica TaxID=434234 RepID=A0ACC1B915_9ROSI|nr:hypothetical protein Patl1_17268 [Pistacia atlantica]
MTEKILDHSTGDVADEFYYLYKEDVAAMKEIGLDTFRFSISWPRVLPSSKIGYATGIYAPGRCSNYIGICTEGNSATEPYLVTHHLILSHATAANLYRHKYQASQNGIIGVTVDTIWEVPKYQTISDRKAALRALDFYIGW